MSTSERDSLKALADQQGLTYKENIPTDRLRALVYGAADEVNEPVAVVEESLADKRLRIRNAALKLIRVNITCMNPAKAAYTGELFTIGNSIIPTITKMVPFGTPEGYHIPQILLDHIKNKEFQTFIPTKGKNGIDTVISKRIREYAVEILTPLSPKEISDIAKLQAMKSNQD